MPVVSLVPYLLLPLQLLHQLHQIEGAAPVAAGLHHYVAPLADAEVGIPPALEAVESGAVGGGLGAGGIGEHHRVRTLVSKQESSQWWPQIPALALASGNRRPNDHRLKFPWP